MITMITNMIPAGHIVRSSVGGTPNSQEDGAPIYCSLTFDPDYFLDQIIIGAASLITSKFLTLKWGTQSLSQCMIKFRSYFIEVCDSGVSFDFIK